MRVGTCLTINGSGFVRTVGGDSSRPSPRECSPFFYVEETMKLKMEVTFERSEVEEAVKAVYMAKFGPAPAGYEIYAVSQYGTVEVGLKEVEKPEPEEQKPTLIDHLAGLVGPDGKAVSTPVPF